VGSIGWIWFGSPLPLRLSIALALVAAIALTIIVGLFIRRDLPKHWKRALLAGTGLISLLGTLVSLPTLEPGAPGSGIGTTAPTPVGSTSATSDGDPLTAQLDFKVPVCEDFTIPKSLLPDLPTVVDEDVGLDAKWIYENGGATIDDIGLTIQGKTEDVVEINRLRIVDITRHTPPADAVYILGCPPAGGILIPRYFEMILSDPPRVKAKPYYDEENKTRPPVKFPLWVSSKEFESFRFNAAGPDCFCDWRLPIDWTSGGRSVTTVVDRRFSKIRSDTSNDADRPTYWLWKGKWQER
jgi:hypothetical protein